MAAEHVVGITAEVLVVIVAVDEGAQTVNVRVVDDNMNPLTPAVTLPMGLVHVVGIPLAVDDVIEQLSDGRTTVVRFVDPVDPSLWSNYVSGVPVHSSLGWKKVGTFTPSP